MPAGLIVTRPAREAARWVDELRAAGVDAVALPLIAIAPLDDAGKLHAARQGLHDYDALMFVSAAAVEHFFAGERGAGGTSDMPSARPRCWATGPGTARALHEAGVPASAIDAPPADAGQFDSEALWVRVQPQVRPGTRLLIVRGGDASGHAAGRDWLAREVAAAGGAVDTVVAYRRIAPVFGDAERQLAAEGAAGAAIWLFSSSEAIGNLCRAMPETAWRPARAIATHERIAQAAREAGFGEVRISQPSQAAVLASIESFQ
jgi:uroporphyrinogen-III synthase